jgi:hypothetical protein
MSEYCTQVIALPGLAVACLGGRVGSWVVAGVVAGRRGVALCAFEPVLCLAGLSGGDGLTTS